MPAPDHHQNHAVVIGASLAGLLAAKVLADRFERVTVIERDPAPAGLLGAHDTAPPLLGRNDIEPPLLGRNDTAPPLLGRNDTALPLLGRKGVPQSHHPHILLAEGLRVLESLFPGVSRQLAADGAVPSGDYYWYRFGIWLRLEPFGVPMHSHSHPFLEQHLRRRLEALPRALEVVNLLKPPRSLLHPDVLIPVLVRGKVRDPSKTPLLRAGEPNL